jgi:protein-S-isoprenylcysteine O-methyltransferase Ste14
VDPIGKSPISLPLLVIGKTAMITCWCFFLVKSLNIAGMVYDSAVTRAVGVLLFAAGLVLVMLAFVSLGASLSVGLPEGRTELKTGGVYRMTRNPIYLGAFLMCGGSCLYAIHPVNALLLAVTLFIHHRIVRKEEEFLEKRFGQEWLHYRKRVPRYCGRIGTDGNSRHGAQG